MSMDTYWKQTLGAVVLAAAMACAPQPRHARYEVVYVSRTPPPPRAEVVTVRPGRGFVWVPGYWRWDRDAYLWEAGHWERAPRIGARWVPGTWRHERRGWYWVPGHWR